MRKNIAILAACLLFVSCEYLSFRKDRNEVVARVDETYLYKSDLENIVKNSSSPQDSLLLVRSYVNSWVKQQLLLSKARLNLKDQTDQFNELVKKYEEDLIINSYKEAVVKTYLDTIISQDDVDEYYRNNLTDFRLNEDLMQFRFVKIAKNLPNKDELKKLFRSKDSLDTELLMEKEMELKSLHLNDSVWVKYKEVMGVLPILNSLDKMTLLKKDNFIEKEDSLNLYLVSIRQVLFRNEEAPKSYIEPTIRQMILHQRKLQLIKNIEETLLEDAQKKQQFEIY